MSGYIQVLNVLMALTPLKFEGTWTRTRESYAFKPKFIEITYARHTKTVGLHQLLGLRCNLKYIEIDLILCGRL